VDEMLAAGSMQTEYRFETSMMDLLREIAKRPKLARVFIQRKNFLIDLKA